MKNMILTLILTLGLLPGLNLKADAQQCHPQSQVFISGYQRCGTPIYMVRYFAGYDCHGHAIWRVRALNQYEHNRYYGSCQRSYPRYAGYGQSRITYTSSSGHGTTTIYYSNGLPARCGR